MRRSTYRKPSILARLMHSTLMRTAVTAPAMPAGKGVWHEWELKLVHPAPMSAPLCRARVVVGGAL